ncbi:hypothetical protein TrVE_jg945 [Triparma verrucosa]|uniref:Uncharacterized protein n=1 Tax=Triparma verrucosa TaxID=1606542 RepID=A0A9W7FG15_9STRA|nr:hypothetical protein TrVE_jg945 [Triparma verrucosa]
MTRQKIKTADGDDVGKHFNEEGENNNPAAGPAVTKRTLHDFFYTDDWRRLFIENAPLDTLMTMRLLCKDWRRVLDKFIDGKIESGGMIVVGGNDLSCDEAFAQEERRSLVTQVVFLLNIAKVGDRACSRANLVVVDIPEGVEYIGYRSFMYCSSLTTVSFPTTLRLIGVGAFQICSSLDNVDLLHTQLQELGDLAFEDCSELKSMTIPDSLQTLGEGVFNCCLKLVPFLIDVSYTQEYDPKQKVIVPSNDLTKSAAIRKARCERLGLTY